MTLRSAVSNRHRLVTAARITLSLGLLALIVSRVHVSAIAAVLTRLDWSLAALGLVVGFISIVLSAAQWQVLLRGRRIEAGLRTLTALYLLGMTFGQLLPSSVGGDVAKAVYLGRSSGRMADAAGATVMARVVGLVALVLTSLPVGILAPILLPGFSWLPAVIFITAGLVMVLAFLTLMQGRQLIPEGWVERLHRSRLRAATTFVESMAGLSRQPATLGAAIGVSAVFYLFSNLNFYVYGQALHIEAPFWFYWIAIPITALATMLPISVNGYGIRGASFVLLFSVMGVPAAAALGLALTMEIQMLLFAAAGGLVLLAYRTPGTTPRPATETLAAAQSIRQEA